MYDYTSRVEYLGIGVYGHSVIGHKCVVEAVDKDVVLRMVDGSAFGEALLKLF